MGPLLVRVTGPATLPPYRRPGANAGGTGLTAGSDRQPPARLTNRLWIAQSGANTLAYLSFQ
jgi:hypothetical protein